MKGLRMSDYRPGYSCGATMPMATARWIYGHAIDRVSLSPELFHGKPKLRLHSGGSHLDVHCNWGLDVAPSVDQLGRPAVMQLEHIVFKDIEAVVQWEERQTALAAA
jgi:hypothetical protein